MNAKRVESYMRKVCVSLVLLSVLSQVAIVEGTNSNILTNITTNWETEGLHITIKIVNEDNPPVHARLSEITLFNITYRDSTQRDMLNLLQIPSQKSYLVTPNSSTSIDIIADKLPSTISTGTLETKIRIIESNVKITDIHTISGKSISGKDASEVTEIDLILKLFLTVSFFASILIKRD